MTDPGTFTIEEVKGIKDVNVILITHEHADHYHVESIQEVLKNNPRAIVVSNSAVAKLLAEKNIACEVVGDGQALMVEGTHIEGFGKDHAIIYGTLGQCENTGYFVDNIFYFPGDSFHEPKKPVDILALPLAGPWMKLSEAIDFAKAVKPRVAFPVHDGMIKQGSGAFQATILNGVFKEGGTEFVPLNAGESKQF
jgi:L-ascorbate metabolism protein UlaG (beta-lactamase superfamily)